MSATRPAAPLDPIERLVMDDDRRSVGCGTDVELEAVAARHIQRGEECRQCVLRGAAPVTAVGEAERGHRQPACGAGGPARDAAGPPSSSSVAIPK